MKLSKIQLLADNPNSWIIPYAKELERRLQAAKYDAKLIYNHSEVKKGDVLCLLSCEKLFSNLDLNKFNLVVHESDLPQGKGWSPVTWQVLEGKKKIPITLFEAEKSVDSGVIYLKDYIHLEGHELNTEIKHLQGDATIQIIMKFLKEKPQGTPQEGESTFYPRRRVSDSELDLNKTIEEQFDLLRVCDNERYPAFVIKDGIKYLFKIYKDDQ